MDEIERALLQTSFVSSTNATREDLHNAILIATSNPIMDQVLEHFGGILLVLNDHRQIVAINHELLHKFNVANADELLGRRPGDVFGCIQSNKVGGACGTADMCQICGAGNAIQLCQLQRKTIIRECLMTRVQDGQEIFVEFQVRAMPLNIEDRQFTLIFMQDITALKRKQMLERIFFHDVLNTICALQGYCDYASTLKDATKLPQIMTRIQRLSKRLMREVQDQKLLVDIEEKQYQANFKAISLHKILEEIQESFVQHSLTNNRRLLIAYPQNDCTLITDETLLIRVLINMVKNALEATQRGQEAKLWCEIEPQQVSFFVWNNGEIPHTIAQRIFQRYFSTKAQTGRGLGTHSIKLLGEQYLKGHVDFHTSKDKGTTFFIIHPNRVEMQSNASLSI
jgi:hypothetical protein